MKTKPRSLINILFSLILLIPMLLPKLQAQAGTLSRSQQISKQNEQPPLEQRLIILHVDMPDFSEFTKSLSPSEAGELAERLAFRQYLRLLPRLEEWKQSGIISDYEFRADLKSVLVEAQSIERFSRLYEEETVADILPLGKDGSACAINSTQEVAKQLERISKVAISLNSQVSVLSSDIQATNPSIDISWYEEDGWGAISGKTSPNTTVNLRIIRKGEQIVSKTTNSNGEGFYYFLPNYLGCPTNTYDFLLREGDIVEVSAGGKTVSTEVVGLRAWLDPVTNQVNGFTAPGRQIKVEIKQSNLQNPCEQTDLAPLTGTAAGNGQFIISTPDINRTAYAQILAMDSNGNGIYEEVDAFHILVYPSYSQVSFSIKPDASFTVLHRRGGNILSTQTGRSYSSGWAFVHVQDLFQAGDVVEINSDGANMQYTLAELSNVNINPNTDQISGVTAPGIRVAADVYKSNSSVIPTTCQFGYLCQSQTADGTGNFNIPAGLDLARGDWVNIHLFDEQGNRQFMPEMYIPAISLNPNKMGVNVLWNERVDSLIIRHLNSAGEVKSSQVVYTNSFYAPEYYGYLSSSVEAGDRIEATDGIRTETLTVPAVLPTARLSSATGRLSGTFPTGSNRWIAEVYDFRFPETSRRSCFESSSGGGFDVPLSGVQVSGGDNANIYFQLSDGHYLNLYRNAFQVFHWSGETSLSIDTETPRTSITARLRRGSTDISTVTGISDNWGYGYLFFEVPSQSGDQILVSTGDGNSYTLNVRELSANLDPSANRIYGKSPANQPIWVYLRRYISPYYSTYIRQTTTAGSDGNYSVSYNNYYWTFTGTCDLASVGHRCSSASLVYYDSGGHGLSFWSPTPPSAPADNYENDNSIETARPYLGVQTHTFDVESDEDWVSFTVPQSDVDNRIRYRIQTFNRGYSTYTTIELFRADGTYLLTGYEEDGITWQPDAAGTYYVRISPWSASSAQYCDAYYDLLILPVRAELFLPLIRR